MLQPLIYIPAAGGTSPLLTNLVAYWKLDESSGTRIDSHGSNNLTDNNTVGSATGKIGNAASFVSANEEYLSIPTSSFSASFTDEASLNLWVRRDLDIPLTPATSAFLKLEADAASDNHYPFTDNNDYIRIFRTSRFTINPRLSGVPDRTVWHMLTITTTPGTNGYKIYQNGILEYQNSGQATVSLGTTLFFGTGTAAFYYGGLFDEVGLWSRALTASEITQLYNSGSGLTYPF
jgi:hypothetical protein